MRLPMPTSIELVPLLVHIRRPEFERPELIGHVTPDRRRLPFAVWEAKKYVPTGL
jgi:hypothetical protein